MAKLNWFAAVMIIIFGSVLADEDYDDIEFADEECSSKCDTCFWDLPIFCTVQCNEPVTFELLVEEPPLMRPFIADPRQVTYSAGWRFDDDSLVQNVIPVSFGDLATLVRFYNVWPWCGELEVGLEGAVWAVFDPLHESSPLINADYYVGVPITYAIDRWQFRLRGYHISSHVGDEFLLNHPFFHRKNPSAEYLDFFISHDLTDSIRVYAGLGYIVHQDNSFRCKRFYADIGGEIRPWGYGFYDEGQCLYGVPFFAIYARHRGEFHNHADVTYALGYELGKTYGLERRMRVYVEYHDGYSLEGQFSHEPTSYLALRITYGF